MEIMVHLSVFTTLPDWDIVMFPQKQVNDGLIVSIQTMQKTGKQVTRPLNQSTLNWLPDRNGCKPGQKVFNMTCLSVCDRCLKKMAAAAGIKKDVSFHTSRYSMATLLLAAVGDLYTVSKLFGHTSINSTSVYADVVMKTKMEAVNRISEFFSNMYHRWRIFLQQQPVHQSNKQSALLNQQLVAVFVRGTPYHFLE